MWKVGDRLPGGFALKQLPLIRVGYTHEFLRVQRQICSYNDVRDRFAMELCEFLMKHTTFVKTVNDIYVTTRMSDITNI